jgi:hypothetical protein
MKRAITRLIFDFDQGVEWTFDAPDPCKPLHAVVDYEPKKSLIVRSGHGKLVPVAKLYVEIDPNAPPRKRRYVALPEHRILEHAGPLTFVAMFTNPETNLRVAIYEVPAEQPQLDDSRCAVCAWPLEDSASKGCTRGNCSQRPRPENLYDPERAKREFHELVKPAGEATQPFRAGDVVEVLVGTCAGERWVVACYDAERDVAHIAGYPDSAVPDASVQLRVVELATDEQHAQMIVDVLASSGPRRAVIEAIQARGGTP